MDEIRIEELEIYAYHGVYQHEKENGQHFYVNATLYTDVRRAGTEDKLELSTDYGAVCKLIQEVMTADSFDLIEAAAENTAREILLRFPLIKSVDLEIRKPEAPVGLPLKSVSVRIGRSWHTAYIAFGSNLGEREKYLREAIGALRQNSLCKVKEVSELYRTTPYGGVEQEEFLNGVLELETLLQPLELLDELQELERQAGRERKVHWGPRTLDLDILFYDAQVIDTKRLTVPHPDMANRDFVLAPLSQIAGRMRHPLNKLTVRDMLEQLLDKGERHIVNSV